MKPELNERLVRVGPGTPAGTMMRRYWQPALLASEVQARDGAPVRVRLLGEDLIAYRDSSGTVGLVDAYCPHRRAPMFFGRNEDCGIRCVYHGWKFDTTGACVDMPSEPTGTPLKDKVRIKAYPTHEAGGIIWTYMGPEAKMPPPPDLEYLRVPESHRWITKTYEACNYLQAMEGGFDSTHSSFLHNNNIGAKYEPRNADSAPKIEVEHTDYGYSYNSTRRLPENRRYIRVYHYVMPLTQLRGNVNAFDGKRREHAELSGHIWVPIDDTQTNVYNLSYAYDQSYQFDSSVWLARDKDMGRAPSDFIPGTFKLRKNLSNDFMIDRELQKTRTFTGITGVSTQDVAVQEGMGPIVDRSQEFLGTSDMAVVQLRRQLFEAIDDVEAGKDPRGVDPRTYARIRPYDDMLEGDEDWKQKWASNLAAKW